MNIINSLKDYCRHANLSRLTRSLYGKHSKDMVVMLFKMHKVFTKQNIFVGFSSLHFLNTSVKELTKT